MEKKTYSKGEWIFSGVIAVAILAWIFSRDKPETITPPKDNSPRVELAQGCAQFIKNNAKYPSSVDLHLISGLSIEKQGNSNYLVMLDFDAKNSLGNELPHTARCLMRPDATLIKGEIFNR